MLQAPPDPHHTAVDAMRERGLRPAFADEALRQAEAARRTRTGPRGDIRDLRGVLWFSIDNDDTQDLDQLSVAEALLGGAARRRVAVADVQALRFGSDGHVHVVERGGGDAHADAASPPSAAGGDTVRLHRRDGRTGDWSMTAPLAGVTAFALSPDGGTYAVAAGGRVQVAAVDGGSPAQVLAPDVAADLLAFGGDATRVLAHAPAPASVPASPPASASASASAPAPAPAQGQVPAGGVLHLWRRPGGGHWTVPVEARPSAMAVTRDGGTVLAVVAHGDATRGGTPYRLLRWRPADPSDTQAAVELGRRLAPPASVCEGIGEKGGIGVAAADLPACGEATAAAAGWCIRADGRQATVVAPSGAVVAGIDHAAGVLRGAVSADGREAATLDEGGHVQRFAVAPKDLIAQACLRQPAPLADEVRTSLPEPARQTDACGHAPRRPP